MGLTKSKVAGVTWCIFHRNVPVLVNIQGDKRLILNLILNKTIIKCEKWPFGEVKRKGQKKKWVKCLRAAVGKQETAA